MSEASEAGTAKVSSMTFCNLSEWRNWLLEFKSGTDLKEEDFKNFEKCFEELLIILADNTIGEKKRVECIDTVGLLLLKVSQILKHRGHHDLDERFRKNLIMVERATFLFHYVIDFWTDNTISLELPLRNMFAKLLKVLNLLYGDYMKSLFEQWLRAVLSLQKSMKVQYFLIEVFAEEIDLSSIQDINPGFIDTCMGLMYAENLCTPVGKSLSRYLLNLYQYRYTDATLNEWLDLWKSICCKYLKDPKFTKRIQLYVLSPVFKQVPGSFEGFIRDHQEFPPPLILSLLKIGQELGLEEEPFHEEKYISMQNIILLLQQDEYKLGTFELVTHSTKRSKQIQPYVYDLLKENLIYFFVDYNLQTRNYFHGSLKLFINRVRDSTYSLNRDALKLRAKRKFPEEQRFNLQQVEIAKDFMYWLFSFLKSQITPGSQYQRSSIALKIMITMIVSGIDNSISEKYLDSKQRMEYPFNINMFDDTLLRLLIDQLINDYDDIREDALLLLKMAFESKRGRLLMKSVNTSILFERSLVMLSSYKLGDGGAKVCEFLFMISLEQKDFFEKISRHLRSLVDNARCNLIDNISMPVAGIFTALAYMIRRYDFPDNCDNECIVQSCIDMIIQNWDTVHEIVCHDSPEGNLPQKYLNCGVSDQVITSYAFRSIKESSLLLKNLLAYAPLDLSQILQVGNLLIEQLSTVRHSGAFQSIFPTYFELCARARRDCPTQLEQWLYSSVSSLQTKSQHITRRSGGLPLMISAILAVEPNENKRWLSDTFTKLFEIAMLPVLEHEEKLDLPQVHAFNCIKGIFADSRLSHHSSPFVSSALDLCLQNFISPTWSIRNCSVMLFTALQNRFFGKVGKSSSARLFFTRFGGVRENLIANLRNALIVAFNEEQNEAALDTTTSLVSSQSKIESIFLVFTILSRLKPTLGYEGLDEFKIETIKALGCENWKIREMASRSLVALVDDLTYEATALVNSLLHGIQKQDKIHGNLLATKELLHLELSRYSSSAARNNLMRILISNFDLFLWCNHCYITAKIYVEIIQMLLEAEVVTGEYKSKIISIFGNYFIRENAISVQDGSKQLLLAQLIRILIKYESRENIPEIILLAIYSEYFEVQLAALNELLNIDMQSENQPDIFDALVQLIACDDTWVPIKARALEILEKNGIKISSSLLSNLLSNKSEVLQGSVLANLTVFEGIEELTLLNLTQKYSSDASPTHMRLSAAKCLIKYASDSPTLQVIFRLYLMLSDDDFEVRNNVSGFFTKRFIKTSEDISALAPYAVARRLAKLLPRLFDHEKLASVVLETFLAFDPGMDVNISNSVSEDELFAKERDNQFRNDVEFGLQLIDMMKSINSELILESVKKLEAEFYEKVKLSTSLKKDDFLRWGSNPDTFTRLILFRTFIGSFGNDITSVDNILREKNCHPYLLDYSS